MTVQDSLWDAVDNDNGGDGNEPPQRAGPAALAPVPAGQIQQGGGPGEVLREPGRAGGRGDRGAVPGVRGAGDPGGERGGQAGAPDPGDEPGDRGSVRGTGDPDPGQPGRAAGGPGPGDFPCELAPRFPWPPLPDDGPRFKPAGIGQLAPSGARARIQANHDALEVAADIVIGGAPLTAEAQDKMGRYGGWGAADGVFAPGASGNDLRDRERLRAILARLGGSAQAGERLFSAVAMTVLNAHYTDPVLVRAMYRALGDLGLEQGIIVEAGVGAGQFAAFAPGGIRITGIELDPATALVAQLLHPEAEILVGSVFGPRFARVRDQSANPVRVPRDTADGFSGNVPFSDVKWPDEVLNPGTRFPLHDHAIRWGVTRVAPGGLCAFITSRYTADKQNPGFRRTLAGEMDLIGMVRLPSTAHKRMAGTPVVTDIIVGRRLADGERPRTDPEAWEQARPLPLPGSDLAPLVNTYFHANPQHVLGTLQAGGMRRAGDFSVAPSGDLEKQLGAALGEIAGRALAAGQRHEPRPAARPVIEILSRRPDGTVTANPNGTFTQVVHGQEAPLEISNAREADQTRRLVELAEALAALRTAEAACAEDTDETDAVRARMGELYDAYTDAYGAIGRFTVRTQNYHVKTLKAVLDRLDFSKADVPDPEVTLLEAYLGRGALTRIVQSVTDPGHVRHGTRKDKQGNEVPTQTQLVQVASVRAALTAALAEIPQGEDAERLTAAWGRRARPAPDAGLHDLVVEPDPVRAVARADRAAGQPEPRGDRERVVDRGHHRGAARRQDRHEVRAVRGPARRHLPNPPRQRGNLRPAVSVGRGHGHPHVRQPAAQLPARGTAGSRDRPGDARRMAARERRQGPPHCDDEQGNPGTGGKERRHRPRAEPRRRHPGRQVLGAGRDRAVHGARRGRRRADRRAGRHRRRGRRQRPGRQQPAAPRGTRRVPGHRLVQQVRAGPARRGRRRAGPRAAPWAGRADLDLPGPRRRPQRSGRHDERRRAA